ncbi:MULTISPECIES: glutamate 5-kinase [Rothia]|uniref:Glutamate 5-kinase n=1 Tax=Rothia kristinae TaxID=37923 RepID=A0A199NS53_9MICC|nr:glutamate 5-kinase [Rothia kristinae]TDP56976.1 glutamate 5-kinase [Kocuria sp. AG109]SIM66529.1 gamma-glutamyl kinase [Mycobacteroides abscessus subsp. abscessus]MCA1169089.1 glutamate 5-kinase [Rothia kristinae]MCT1358266.1 glutamate 5-kinase [Rothia kristinae]MCT1393963.1 glutamate 5-kinase [Rothia kristinae]
MLTPSASLSRAEIQRSAESRGKNRISPIERREDLPKAKRIVVKVGSSSLTSIAHSLDELAVATIADVLAKTHGRGVEVVFVSSGAIAAGLAPLGLTKRPKDLATQQAAAAVGQSLIMTRYTEIFSRYDVTISQVLVTAEDLMHRSRYHNVHRQLERLLDLNVLPIVNENDAVATHEIKFGDNDRIAALVAHTIKADALLLLSDVDALYTKHPAEGGERISTVTDPERDLEGVEIGTIGRAGVGSGGMVTKVEAAKIASSSGIPALVTSAANAAAALDGADVGTWFQPTGGRRSIRLVWLSQLAKTKGAVTVDAGAERAVRRRTSLLAAGITGVEGIFRPGEPIAIKDPQGRTFAHGLAAYSSQDIERIAGLASAAAEEELGDGFDGVVVHVDNLAVLRRR